jgi:hypothetical protein
VQAVCVQEPSVEFESASFFSQVLFREASSYRLDVSFQDHGYGLSMFCILLGDDGQIANFISVVVLKILQRFLKVQGNLVGDLVGRHDFFLSSQKKGYYFQQKKEMKTQQQRKKRKETTSHG